jgi:hypothetical protein
MFVFFENEIIIVFLMKQRCGQNKLKLLPFGDKTLNSGDKITVFDLNICAILGLLKLYK